MRIVIAMDDHESELEHETEQKAETQEEFPIGEPAERDVEMIDRRARYRP